MQSYEHILMAVDFYDQYLTMACRGKDLAEKYQAKLSLIHVMDSVPITDVGFGGDIPVDLDLMAELTAAAKKRLVDLAGILGVDENDCWIEVGSPKAEIVRVAEENQVDLIVLGSHGRHGLALLLGSTANGVLHYAKCDVLAVRLQEK